MRLNCSLFDSVIDFYKFVLLLVNFLSNLSLNLINRLSQLLYHSEIFNFFLLFFLVIKVALT